MDGKKYFGELMHRILKLSDLKYYGPQSNIYGMS